MSQLILMRHAQSVWNQSNLFTGWVDVPLSRQGIDEALNAGQLIANEPIDLVITSSLIRAEMTALIAMSVHHSKKTPVLIHSDSSPQGLNDLIFDARTKENTIPVMKAAQLNERKYGELQGLNKAETIKKYGEEQVKLWRRSYDHIPPGGESLKMTAERAIPYFQEIVIPLLDHGLNLFVCAHGNSLRSIIMHIEKLSKEEVLQLELETGMPIIYQYDKGRCTKSPSPSLSQ